MYLKYYKTLYIVSRQGAVTGLVGIADLSPACRWRFIFLIILYNIIYLYIMQGAVTGLVGIAAVLHLAGAPAGLVSVVTGRHIYIYIYIYIYYIYKQYI